MAEAPLVSVLIPAYNYAHLLPQTLRSVFDQRYRPIEVIVVDDGSSDQTPSVLASTPGIIVVRQENQGLSAARNTAMRMARGRYLQFLDADDLLGPSAISRRVALLEAHPDLSSVVCRSALFRDRVLPEWLAWLGREWRHPPCANAAIGLRYRNIAPPHAFLVRRAIVEQHGLRFDESLRAVEDYDFWLRLSDAAGPPALLRSGWVYYRQHARSMSRNLARQHAHDALVFHRICERELDRPTYAADGERGDRAAALFLGFVEIAEKLRASDPDACETFLAEHLDVLAAHLAQHLRQDRLGRVGWVYLASARQFVATSVRRRLFAETVLDRMVGATHCGGWLFLRACRARTVAGEGAACLLRLLWRDFRFMVSGRLPTTPTSAGR